MIVDADSALTLACSAPCRRVTCSSLYTAHEGFGRLMMIHASHGGQAATFEWRRYAAERVGRGRQPVDSWYAPPAAVQLVAQDVLARGLFEKVTLKNRGNREGSRRSVVRSSRWTGYRVQKVAGTRHKLSLAPFDARVSREESALRLALEADVSGKAWYRLAVARIGSGAASQPGGGRARNQGSKRKGTQSQAGVDVSKGRVTRAAASVREASAGAVPTGSGAAPSFMSASCFVLQWCHMCVGRVCSLLLFVFALRMHRAAEGMRNCSACHKARSWAASKSKAKCRSPACQWRKLDACQEKACP